MKRWPSESLLDGSKNVIRVTPRKAPFYDPPEYLIELPNIFYPSSVDEEVGKRTGMQPLVSVWDEELPLADILRNRNIDPQLGYGALILNAGDVKKLHSMSTESAPLEIHSDPSPDANHIRPHLHCGIQGLSRHDTSLKVKPTSVQKETLLRKLLDLTTRHPDSSVFSKLADS